MPIKYYSAKDIDKGIDMQNRSTAVLWATGRNVRFTKGHVSKSPGKTLLETLPSGLPIREMFTFSGTDGAERTIVCGDDSVYAYDASFSSYTDITPSPAPTGGESDVWQFALVSGLPILSNGKDPIWKWASFAGVLTALSGAPTFAKRISSCMNRLVVSNLQEGGNSYTGRIRWSEMGNPENWTIDTTNKSGRFDLMHHETGISAYQNIKAQIADGNKVYFFTERGLWVSDFAQETKPFLIAGKETEIMSPRALCKSDRTIFWIGKQDVYSATDGNVTPIGLPIRGDLFGNVNQGQLSLAYAFHNRGKLEIWFCVPTGTNAFIDTAYVYNYELKNWTIVDVDFLCHSESEYPLLPFGIVGNSHGEILRLDYGDNGYHGGSTAAINGTIESGDMDFDFPGNVKRISLVAPDAIVQSTICELMIQIGVRNRLADDIRWSDPVPFTIGVSERADFNGFRKDGKLVRFRFYSDQFSTPWSLAGYEIEYEIGGTR